MSSLFKKILLLIFIFYAVSPLSYAQSDKGPVNCSHSEDRLANLRLFLLEHILDAASDDTDSEAPSSTVMLRKKRALTSITPNWKLIVGIYLVDAYRNLPLIDSPRAFVFERSTTVISPKEIFSLYSSSLSPPVL